MMNYPTESNFVKPLPAYPVTQVQQSSTSAPDHAQITEDFVFSRTNTFSFWVKMCKIIDGFTPEATKLCKVFVAASLYYNYSQTEKCFQLEDKTDDHGLHGWNWQACTEMVMPMIVSNQSMFPPSSFSYKKYTKDCMKNYGVRPRQHWITTEFGGMNIEQVLKKFGSNIIFSNGLQDPWSRGSVLKNISASIVALVAEKGAHHTDLRPATRSDPDWLIEQRRQEIEIIKKWISDYYTDMNEL